MREKITEEFGWWWGEEGAHDGGNGLVFRQLLINFYFMAIC